MGPKSTEGAGLWVPTLWGPIPIRRDVDDERSMFITRQAMGAYWRLAHWMFVLPVMITMNGFAGNSGSCLDCTWEAAYRGT